MNLFFSNVKKGWMAFAHTLGKINTRILLFLIYFIFFGIYAIIAWILKLLMLPFKKIPESYWIDRKDEFDIDSFKYPF